MRYLCPDACVGVSHAGVMIVKADDGTIEAPAEAAAALAPHGVVPVRTPKKLAAAPRDPARDDRRMLR